MAEAQRWLRYAAEDLRAAEKTVGAEGFEPRHACWHAQQAAEKAIKAALVLEQTAFPKSHDLEQLRALLPSGWAIRHAEIDLPALTRWATESRYPTFDEADTEEAGAALEQARQVVGAVRDDLGVRGAE